VGAAAGASENGSAAAEKIRRLSYREIKAVLIFYSLFFIIVFYGVREPHSSVWSFYIKIKGQDKYLNIVNINHPTALAI